VITVITKPSYRQRKSTIQLYQIKNSWHQAKDITHSNTVTTTSVHMVHQNNFIIILQPLAPMQYCDKVATSNDFKRLKN